MSKRSIGLDETLWHYLVQQGIREPDILRRLREETARLPEANMQIAPEQGAFLHLMVKLTGARRLLEIGTFTGYSALAMALALPPQGRLHCCDRSETWTAIARRYWREAGVEDRIQLHLGPALDTLHHLLETDTPPFDLVFIDADKDNYLNYYETSLRLLRPGGLILIDNTLWNGTVADPHHPDPTTQTLRTFNAHLHDDPRIDLAMTPIGDGLTLARKRHSHEPLALG